jgi:hypothetical protein
MEQSVSVWPVFHLYGMVTVVKIKRSEHGDAGVVIANSKIIQQNQNPVIQISNQHGFWIS